MSALTIFDVVESSDSVRLPLASVPLGTLCALVVLSCRQPAAPLEIKIDDQARIVDRARLEAILSSPVFSGPGPPGAIPTEVVVTCYMNSDSSGYARMERAFQFDRGLIVDATTSASFAEISRRWLLEVGYTPPESPDESGYLSVESERVVLHAGLGTRPNSTFHVGTALQPGVVVCAHG
jgi:hypothetical protein